MTPTVQKPGHHFAKALGRAGRPTARALGKAPARIAERTR